MKKLLCLVLFISLLSCSAFAQDSPALVDPQQRYDQLVEESDGSEELIFGLMDSMNDEEELVEKNGDVAIKLVYLINDGVSCEEMMTTTIRLYSLDFGLVTALELSSAGEVLGTVYTTLNNRYMLDEDGVCSVDKSDMDDEQFLYAWHWFVFPYMPIELLQGIRQDEDETTYFLVRSDDEVTLEYVTERLLIKGFRQYEKQSDGTYLLTLYSEVTAGDGVEIPEAVLKAMQENESGESGEGA